jgi:hypothetical protein
MPKRILAFAFAVSALALAACNNGNVNNLYGSATPTPVPTSTASPSPDPSASAAVVTVTYQGVAQGGVPVTLYTSVNGSIGTQITQQTTNSSGQTTFKNLTPAIFYCFGATFQPPATPPPPTPSPRSQSECTPYWGTIGVSFAF